VSDQTDLCEIAAPLKSLLPRQSHPFAKPLWDIRLQAIWITFTGIYVIVGTTYVAANPLNARWLSSAFLTIAGGLVLLLVCHTVIAMDRNASRKTLLVALTACLFFVQKSYDTYHDVNGLIFAIIFSSIILTVLWLTDESPVRDRIMLTSIAVLLAAIAFSGFQLLATLLEQRLLRWQNIPPQVMIVSPHVAGILSGMMSFLVLDSFIAKSANRMQVPRSDLPRRFFLFFGCAIVTVTFTYLANEARFRPGFLNTGLGVAFTVGYVAIHIFTISICVWIACRYTLRLMALKVLALCVLAGVSGYATASLHMLVDASSGLQSVHQLYLVLYCIPMVSLVAAGIACTATLVTICNHLYERVASKETSGLKKM
jgi:hypothetical protein